MTRQSDLIIVNRVKAINVSTSSIDDARVLGSHVYHPHRLHICNGGDGFGMRLRAAAIGPVVTGTLEYLAPVRVSAGAFEDSYHVNLPLFGKITMTEGSRQQHTTRSIASVNGPTAPTTMEGWHEPTRVFGVKIGRSNLEQALARFTGRRVNRPITFEGNLDTRSPDGRLWLALAQRMYWWSRGAHDPNSLVSTTLTEAVLNSLLRTAPHEHSEEVRASATDASNAAQRALTLMHVRADSQAAIADIAGEARIHMRTLEKHFQTRWGYTPSQMLTEIRLTYAQRSLSETTDPSARVAAIAAHWGFTHPGRFAARYTNRFGEPPSTTLACAKAPSPVSAEVSIS